MKKSAINVKREGKRGKERVKDDSNTAPKMPPEDVNAEYNSKNLPPHIQ